MKVHEYQAKEMFSQFGIPVPRGGVASTPAQAREIAARLGGKAVIKAQVYAGGRGKAGGIKVLQSPEEARKLAGEILGKWLVTAQTSAEGVPVSKVLVEEAVSIKQELYLSVLVDGASLFPVMMASEAGGMEIEEVARHSPEKIHKVYIDPAAGFQPFQGRKLAFDMNLDASLIRPAAELMASLYRLFWSKDCALAEINPLVVTAEGKLLALDAKLNFDDSALFRHPELEKLRDPEQEDHLEVKAISYGIRNYIKLEGNIGCMVNGAGLAMAVLDLVTLAEGRPANFLDIGTANTPDRVVNAFRLFTTDPDVRAILVNIFGGIARVDIIAQGIVEAFKQTEVRVPVVVRLAGTNVAEGKRILAQSGLKLIQASDLYDAANKAVEAAKGRS